MIRAFEPHVTPNGSSVCVTFRNGNKEVSIALDDSCGRLQMLSRADIRLFEVDEKTGHATNDLTCAVLGTDSRHNVHASLENFNKAMEWLNMGVWNPEGI